MLKEHQPAFQLVIGAGGSVGIDAILTLDENELLIHCLGFKGSAYTCNLSLFEAVIKTFRLYSSVLK